MKACIAIGVNRVTGAASLPILAAAATGAVQFADWARTQGFGSWSITDVADPVTVQHIFNRIDSIVSAGTCTQLIVYFAGHGILKSADTEMWLLSAAATDANAAVNLVGSVRGARKCGIPHVVFISDACRSIATDPGLSEVTGSSIFPTAKIPRKTEVDIFYATMPGDVSWEVPAEDAAKRYDGIFTRCLLIGLGAPDPELVESVPGDDGDPIPVVSSRTLKPWIEEKVPDAVWKVDIKLNQFPELRVESQRPKYLALVTVPSPAPPLNPIPATGVGVGTLPFHNLRHAVEPRRAGSGLNDLLLGKPISPSPPSRGVRYYLWSLGARVLGGAMRLLGVGDAAPAAPVALIIDVPPTHVHHVQRKLDRVRPAKIPIGETGHRVKRSRLDSAFDSDTDAVRNAQARPGFETRTGFSLTGADVRAAFINGRIPNPNDAFLESGQWHLRVHPNENESVSVLIQFEDGSGTCLAAIPRYVGSILVESGRVSNVSYTPSQYDDRFPIFDANRAEIEERRAIAAAASKRGYFRVEPEEALNYAESLRRFKWLDPTLGLYSAYAYDQSGLSDGVESVYRYMVEDGFVPFDVALLVGKFEPEVIGNGLIAPFCPMLTQGWSLLDETAPVSPAVRAAARHLKPALWTTLTEKGVEILRDES
jgi:hypothetical protein